MPDSTKPVPSYTGWGEVPGHLRTRTALADLDLLRQPAGSVRAVIDRDVLGEGLAGPARPRP